MQKTVPPNTASFENPRPSSVRAQTDMEKHTHNFAAVILILISWAHYGAVFSRNLFTEIPRIPWHRVFSGSATRFGADASMKRNPRVVVRHLLETADTGERAMGDLYTTEGVGGLSCCEESVP